MRGEAHVDLEGEFRGSLAGCRALELCGCGFAASSSVIMLEMLYILSLDFYMLAMQRLSSLNHKPTISRELG